MANALFTRTPQIDRYVDDNGHLEKYLSIIDAAYDQVHSEIAQLVPLRIPDECPVGKLPYLAADRCIELSESALPRRRRKVVEGATSVFQGKGTTSSLRFMIENSTGWEAQIVDVPGANVPLVLNEIYTNLFPNLVETELLLTGIGAVVTMDGVFREVYEDAVIRVYDLAYTEYARVAEVLAWTPNTQFRITWPLQHVYGTGWVDVFDRQASSMGEEDDQVCYLSTGEYERRKITIYLSSSDAENPVRRDCAAWAFMEKVVERYVPATVTWEFVILYGSV